MTKNFNDFVRLMAEIAESDYTVDRLVLTNESLDTFLTDEKMTESLAETNDELGEYGVPVESGDRNAIITESGESFNL